MGAWGYKPTENDEALEWIANEVEMPLFEAITTKIQDFLLNSEDDVKKSEVQAAIALLLGFVAPLRMENGQVDLSYLAAKNKIWEQAISAIEKLKADKQWLQQWNSADKKKEALDDLLAKLNQHKTKRDFCFTN
jgi:hypothetical protein